MKTIIIINDNSPDAGHAAKFALMMAAKMNASILLANIQKVEKPVIEKALAGGSQNYTFKKTVPGLPGHSLTMFDKSELEPSIKEIDISEANENQLAELINKNNAWMVVKGMNAHLTTNSQINLNTLLNKIECPLLLIPASFPLKSIERLVYIADLRYCRLPIVRYLAELAKNWQADLSIAHLSAKGLPDIEEHYACDIFNGDFCRRVNYDRLFFNNIKEKNLTTAIDVIINGLNNDLLVMVKSRFHFKKVIGECITGSLPANITVPLLVFPY